MLILFLLSAITHPAEPPVTSRSFPGCKARIPKKVDREAYGMCSPGGQEILEVSVFGR